MNKQPTADQLKKYVDGQLSRQEQYQVERAALDDPFVAEALDGLMASNNRDIDTTELRLRLQKRVQPAESRQLGFWRWASAAALILAVGLGWIYFQKEEPKELATVESLPQTTTPAPIEEGHKDILPTEKIATNIKKRSVGGSKNKTDVPVAAADIADIILTDSLDDAEKQAGFAEPQVEKAKTAEADAIVIQDTKQSEKLRALPQMAVAKTIAPNQLTVMGVVKAADGSVLPGVSINLKGTNRGVNTDSNGQFRFKDIRVGDKLSISSVGFGIQEIVVRDPILPNIILREDSKALSEVVVTSYNKKQARKAAREAKRKAKKDAKKQN
jgi:CarboxypepD_reg-like domain